MSGDRYIPRRFSSDPKGFGKVAVIRWPDDTFTPDQAMASRMQHQWAMAVHEALELEDLSVRAYCRRHDLSYPRLSNILRGTAVARLEDIASAYRLLEVEPPHDWLR